MKALLLVVYGLPRSLDDIEPYYQHIMHAPDLPAEVLQSGHELFRRYGTVDLMTSVTFRLMKALQRRFDDRAPREQIRVYVSAFHTEPFIDQTVRKIAADGAESLAVLPMSTLYSPTGIGQYLNTVRKTLQKSGVSLPVLDIVRWYRNEAFLEAMADRLRTAWTWLPAGARANAKVIFTVHSKPGVERVHRDFIAQYEELARLVAERAAVLPENWRLAYRSGGPPPQIWLGPDILDCIREEGERGTTGIVTCELLSVTENVEALNDMGTEARQLARKLGMEFVRTEFLNDSDDFVSALAEIVLERMQEA